MSTIFRVSSLIMPKTNNGARVSLTDEQKTVVARWINPHKDLLFGRHDYSAGVSNAAKAKCWTEIHDKAVAAGFPVVSVKHTRETLWDNMKRSTTKKVQLNNQTGQGGSNQLTDLDEAVLDIIGRDSVYLNGTGLEDDRPVLSSPLPSGSSTNLTRNGLFLPGECAINGCGIVS